MQKRLLSWWNNSNLPIEKTVKTLIVKGASEEQPLVALVIRGDHELNEIKAEKFT